MWWVIKVKQVKKSISPQRKVRKDQFDDLNNFLTNETRVKSKVCFFSGGRNLSEVTRAQFGKSGPRMLPTTTRL